jgi:hypothetical protein
VSAVSIHVCSIEQTGRGGRGRVRREYPNDVQVRINEELTRKPLTRPQTSFFTHTPAAPTSTVQFKYRPAALTSDQLLYTHQLFQLLQYSLNIDQLL